MRGLRSSPEQQDHYKRMGEPYLGAVDKTISDGFDKGKNIVVRGV